MSPCPKVDSERKFLLLIFIFFDISVAYMPCNRHHLVNLHLFTRSRNLRIPSPPSIVNIGCGDGVVQLWNTSHTASYFCVELPQWSCRLHHTGFVLIRPNQAKSVFLEKVEKSPLLSVFLLKNFRILVFSVQMLENSE